MNENVNTVSRIDGSGAIVVRTDHSSEMTEESNVAIVEDTKDSSEAKLEGALTYINLMGPGIMKPVEDAS